MRQRAPLLVLLAGTICVATVAYSRKTAPARVSLPSPPTAPSMDRTRALDWAAALLAAAALADSGIEHYRGSFHNRTMYAPLGVAAVTLAASVHDALTAERRRGVADATAIATGAAGIGFHLYNIAKRPGGFSWLNLFYAAPFGAPAALSLAGLLRRMAAARDRPRLLAALVAAGVLGTSAEAGLLHFRGAFHNPAMAVPVTVPPVAAALLLQAAAAPRPRHDAARWSLRVLAAVGLIGSAFHAHGIGRNMGGWRNWSQNLLNGPPLPAPPAFTALALAGLAALAGIEEGSR